MTLVKFPSTNVKIHAHERNKSNTKMPFYWSLDIYDNASFFPKKKEQTNNLILRVALELIGFYSH